MSLPTEPAARHAAVADRFGELVALVAERDLWASPAPVAGWTARDVVAHLLDWLPALLAGGADVHLAAVSVDDDPAAAWAARTAAVQALLEDDASASAVLRNPHLGEVPLPEAIDRFYSTDVFLHTWDLGRAAGVDPGQDPEHCAELLAGMEPIEQVLRDSGQYGPPFPVPDGATAAQRLAAFIGRDPLV